MAEEKVFRNNGQECQLIPWNEPSLLLEYKLTNNVGTSIQATLKLCWEYAQSHHGLESLKVGFECPENVEIDESTLPVIIVEDSMGPGFMGQGPMGPGMRPRIGMNPMIPPAGPMGPGGPMGMGGPHGPMRMQAPGPNNPPLPGQMAMVGPQAQNVPRRFKVDGSFIQNKNQFQVKIQKRYQTGSNYLKIGMEISLIQIDSLPTIKDLND